MIQLTMSQQIIHTELATHDTYIHAYIHAYTNSVVYAVLKL